MVRQLARSIVLAGESSLNDRNLASKVLNNACLGCIDP